MNNLDLLNRAIEGAERHFKKLIAQDNQVLVGAPPHVWRDYMPKFEPIDVVSTRNGEPVVDRILIDALPGDWSEVRFNVCFPTVGGRGEQQLCCEWFDASGKREARPVIDFDEPLRRVLAAILGEMVDLGACDE